MIRSITLADLDAVLALCNEHERRVDPASEAFTEEDIRLQIQGFYEPGHPLGLELDGKIQAVSFSHTDTPRRRHEIDIFSLTTKDQTAALFDATLEHIKNLGTGFEIRTAANQNDVEILQLFESRNFEFYRIYWQLIRNLSQEDFPKLPSGIEIRQLDLESDAELYWKLEMQSFAKHFGFRPIEFKPWLEERNKDTLLDRKGMFVIFDRGVPAGYLFSGLNRAELNGGFVDKLGVVPELQGKGLGRLLLQWGIAYSASLGHSTISLGVDSGNESGALKLYDSVGFRTLVSYVAYLLPALR